MVIVTALNLTLMGEEGKKKLCAQYLLPSCDITPQEATRQV